MGFRIHNLVGAGERKIKIKWVLVDEPLQWGCWEPKGKQHH